MLDVDGTLTATRTEAKKLFHSEDDLGKENKRTGHIGQFIDIVRGGGHEDFEAWKKIQKICQKKKRLKNTTGLNLHILRIIINLVAIPVILIVLTSCNKNTDAFHILEKQRFILVKDQYDINKKCKRWLPVSI